MRNGLISLLAVTVAGLIALLAVGLTRGSSLVYTLGVAPQGAVAKLAKGDRTCQSPIRPPRGAAFERVGFYPRSPNGASTVVVTVRPAAGGPVLASGRLSGAYGEGVMPRLRHAGVGRVQPAQPLAVCFENAGSRPVEIWGTAPIASPSTSASQDGRASEFDLGVTLERSRERSLVALLPDMAHRASVFHPGWVSPAAYALLGAVVLVGIPLLLVLALRRAAAHD